MGDVLAKKCGECDIQSSNDCAKRYEIVKDAGYRDEVVRHGLVISGDHYCYCPPGALWVIDERPEQTDV